MSNVTKIWDTMLSTDAAATDLLATVSEAAINDFLTAHHKHDNDRYSVKLKKQFVVGGKVRDFSITIKAASPVQLELPPFVTTTGHGGFDDKGGWNEIDAPDPVGPAPHYPKEPGAAPNIRVYCPDVRLKFEWPKFEGDGKWEWEPDPFTILAEAALVLVEREGAYYLRVEPTAIKFDKVKPELAAAQVRKLLAKAEAGDKQLSTVIESEEQKFNDLLLITLNIAGSQFAPKLVRDIAVPAPVIFDRKVYPTDLVCADKLIGFGVGIDRQALTTGNEVAVVEAQHHIESLIARDLESYGTLLAALTRDRVREMADVKDTTEFVTAADLPTRFPRLYEFLGELTAEAAPRPAIAELAAESAVKEGFGVAVNQYLLETLARGAMPTPKRGCTDWVTVLQAVRGRICWWLHLYDPKVVISGTTVNGNVTVDIGGAVEACIRKFWDCSWRWECGKVSLSVVGMPGVSIHLVAGKGISLYAQLTGDLKLSTNLPYPFNKVISALSGLVWDILKGLINVAIRNIKFEIMPPTIELPGQKTGLKIAGFSQPFAYTPNTTVPFPSKKVFLGYLASTEAVNV